MADKEYTAKKVLLQNAQGEFLIPYTEPVEIKVDDITVSKDSEEKLQAIGTILQSGGFQKYWQGTKAEFNAIPEKDVNTLYQVLDDEESALFEVDGTSIEFSNDNILQIPKNVDYTVQEQTWGDGESGYRITRNKALTQWGKVTSSANGEVEFTMHTQFKDMNYSIFAQVNELGNFFLSIYPSGVKKFKLRVQSSSGTNMAVKVAWRAYGYFA